MKDKIIYLGLAVDLIHPGHLNIINEAKKYLIDYCTITDVKKQNKNSVEEL
mgnify:CR=1 FL=1|jgi:glycerol-3-phosphate cytidylyltransferase-like family protein